MNLLAYLQRFGLTEVSSLLLFLTDWEHVKNTGLQATKLRWDRQDGRIHYEGELTAKPLGTRWQAAENVLDATFDLTASEVRQLTLKTYPMVTTSPHGPLDLPRLGWDYQNDVQLFEHRHVTDPPSRYDRLMAASVI